MDFINRMQQLAAQVPSQLDHIKTEEATKNALIMPFLQELGYNIFDPTEVVPEFTADTPNKKGEKVDYAIIKDGSPIILIECKGSGTNLENIHASQLYRYFTVTDARFGVLTNGEIYQFYSDLDKQNIMDENPFLVIDMLNFDPGLADELKKFTKSSFDIEDIHSTARELKYKRKIVEHIAAEFKSPSVPFVRHFAGKVYSGPLRQNVVEEFTEITRQALQQYIVDQVDDRYKKARGINIGETTETDVVNNVSEQKAEAVESQHQMEFTDDERDAYLIVKSILREVVDVQRVVVRDVKSYCGILLDDNNRKPICRLHFNRSQKHIGLFDENKNEEYVAIESLDDIYQYADRLTATIANYDGEA